MNLPPSPPGNRLWGHTALIARDPMGYLFGAALRYQPLCRLRMIGMDLYVTAHPDVVRQVFVSRADSFVKGPAFQTLSLLTGQGLVTSEGAFWKRQRRLANPAFHKDKLRGFLQMFLDCGTDVLRQWQGYGPEEVHRMIFEMGELTLRVAGKALFGIDLYREAATVPPDVKQALAFIDRRIYTLPRYPMGLPLAAHLRFFRNRRRLDAVVYRIIDERLRGATAGDDLLQAFLEAVDEETGEKMSREQLRDEVMTLFLAGFETSSNALTWAWYILWQQEEVWAKFQEELRQVVGAGEVRPEHLPQLVYTRAVIEETLRLYPPVYHLQRQLAEDLELEGYPLKKGAVVLTSVVALHRNPACWDRPDEFRPERFLPAGGGQAAKGAYIPFGAGQRMCIGSQFALWEMVAVLAVLGRHLRPRPVEGYVPRMVPSLTLGASEGMPMHIRPF
ncbi:cytochrome P450 [Paraflavisolibacter sp. H34]|uniref:cytochrome P450 n=1 Tax=Huijunlia imazamoxiresistens TaxID=3127457 RepID=UPI0030181AC3